MGGSMGALTRILGGLGSCFLFLACQGPTASAEVTARETLRAPASLPGGSALSVPEAAPPGCASVLQNIEAPETPPASDPAARAHLLGRAKGWPVTFLRTPEPGELSEEGRALRTELLRSQEPLRALGKMLPRLKRNPALARQVLLTGGYLYAERAELGEALVDAVALEHLFRGPSLLLERGRDAFIVERGSSGYVYKTGPETGRRARLLLFDRVHERSDAGTAAVEQAPASLHVDLEAPSANLGFDRATVVRFGTRVVHARLRYGDEWVDAVFDREGPVVRFRCQVEEPSRVSRIRAARDVGRRRGRVVDALRTSIDRQVEESLPFDEPKSEDGQQDGQLRPEWRRAYLDGRSRYTFNEDKYHVFDAQGRPRVPQVCIDFITDTFERAAGSWWGRRGDLRERSPGRLSFGRLGIENQRSVEHFLAFARARPDWFDVVSLPREERTPFFRRTAFFGHLSAHADRYRAGDVVVIYGLRDDEKMHYHSFFVYATDPETGAPVWVAANAGRPRIRSFADEMASAPRRSLHSRIRPRLEWLEAVLELDRNVSLNEEPEEADQRG